MSYSTGISLRVGTNAGTPYASAGNSLSYSRQEREYLAFGRLAGNNVRYPTR